MVRVHEALPVRLALNGTGFASPALDEGLATGEASTDPEERKAAYDTVQQELADNLVQMFTRSATVAVVTNDKIEGGARSSVRTGNAAWGTRPSSLGADEFWRNDQ